jgi:subtilisin family serine protease
MSISKFAFTRLCAGLALAVAAIGTAAAATAAQETARYVVEFKPGMAAAARAALAQAGGRIKLEIIGGEAVAIELPKHLVETLKKHGAIAAISEDAIRVPFSTGAVAGEKYLAGQTVPYGITMVQANLLSDANTANRTLCIIDSGYDLQHEDLKDNNVTGEFDSGTGWWYTDETHHGSHVAGTIAAMNNTGIGVVGVNPNKKLHLHIVKVFGADGAWTYSSTLANAAKKCQAAGANIITMSLGGALNNPLESKTFQNLYDAGILSIAAAGNAGTTAKSYPAGYTSVMSIAAVDSAKQWASFSQYNADVELAAPGVNVLSTVPMGTGSNSTLTVGATVYAPGGMDGSPKATVTAPLADFGLGDTVNAAVAGKICVIQRGNIAFSDKVTNCQNSGGVGAIVYNNVAGGFGGTLGGVATTIPSVTASDTEGSSLEASLGQSATIAVTASNYAYFDGTSMATPHASGVAALVWSYFPTCTNAQIRVSLQKSALDIGDPGKDNKTGYGLIQAKAAYSRIASKGCGK